MECSLVDSEDVQGTQGPPAPSECLTVPPRLGLSINYGGPKNSKLASFAFSFIDVIQSQSLADLIHPQTSISVSTYT